VEKELIEENAADEDAMTDEQSDATDAEVEMPVEKKTRRKEKALAKAALKKASIKAKGTKAKRMKAVSPVCCDSVAVACKRS
jgi:hypothetical protein